MVAAPPGLARPGSDAAPASVLQDVVCGPTDSRAPAGGGAPRERLAGKGGARGHGRSGYRGRADGAVLAGPMESPARPSGSGPRGCVAEEAPPPDGESRYVGWTGPREPPSGGARPPPLRPAEISLVLRTGREGGLGAVAAALGPGRDVRCGGLGAPGRCQVTPRNTSRGKAACRSPCATLASLSVAVPLERPGNEVKVMLRTVLLRRV